MQAQKKQNKSKYVQPQFFSVSGAMKSNNPAHCRSLVDLNSMEGLCHQKQNINMQHFSSVMSNQDSKQINSHKFNIHNNSNSGVFQKSSLSNHKNISNIAKILLNANQNRQKRAESSKNNSLILTQGTKSKNILMPNSGNKNDLPLQLINNQLKSQARTNSQTNIRQSNTSLTKLNGKPKQQLSLQRQKSQKSLSKSPINHKNVNGQADFSLLIKLKQYISVLKQNEHKYQLQIQQLQQQGIKLKQQNAFLKDKMQVYQIREKQMMKKIKLQQSQLKKINERSVHSQQSKSSSDCHQHMLIIQSLKNVINEQMGKIIDLQTNRLQMQEERQRINKNKGNQINSVESQKKARQETEQNAPNDTKLGQFHEVYSFKKRNNLSQSSIYIQDESRQYEQEYSKSRKIDLPNNINGNAYNKNKSSNASIPQPYNQLIKCLRSDSRINSRGSYNQQKSRQQLDSQEMDQSIRQLQQNQQQFGDEQNQILQTYNYRQQCSQDQILHEVGEYLSNIRKNVRES